MANWKNAVLSEKDTMNRAVQVLEENRVLGIVLVLDRDGRLTGTITDGDIRRALIRRCNMDTLVIDFMTTTPVVAAEFDSRDVIREKMVEHFISRIPVVNSDGKVIRVERNEYYSPRSERNNTVLLMAGGFGTRLYPLTKEKPKPLLEVGDKPILESILLQFRNQGFSDFLISIHYKAEMVKNYFGDGSDWDVTIRYLEENQPMGTGGALGLIPQLDVHFPMIVINGDLLTNVDYGHLLEFHTQQQGMATVCVREYDLEVPYGVIEWTGNHINDIVEKPVHTYFINAGIYVLEEAFINNISNEIPLDMTTILRGKIEEGTLVTMFPLHEYWLDIGRFPEYKRAREDVANEFNFD